MRDMNDYKVGERIVLEVQESHSCNECFFYNPIACSSPNGLRCDPLSREDGKNVIFKLINHD